MLQGGSVRSLLIAPPCGLCGTQPGPVLWKRCLALFRLSCVLGAPALLLLPGPACVAFGSTIDRYKRKGLCSTVWLSFALLGSKPGGCLCLCSLLDVRGLEAFAGPPDFSASSALEGPQRRTLGRELLRCFSLSLAALRSEPDRAGIESIAVNDVLCGGSWGVDVVFPWRGDSHINVLELATIVALERRLATSHAGRRIVIFADSQVAKSAAAKGRSSSRSLGHALMRSSALQLAFGLFIAYGFAPTRLNIADDPTRFAELRAPYGTRLYELLPVSVWHAVSALRLRRPLASWGRLFLLASVALLPSPGTLLSLLSGPSSLWPDPGLGHHCLDFDATLGFPGEGPLRPRPPPSGPLPWPHGHSFSFWPSGPRAGSHCFALVVELFLLSAKTSASHLPCLDFDPTLGFPGEGWFLFRVWFLVASAMAVVVPGTPAEQERARLRSPVLLVADRVVRPATRSNREKLAAAFDSWLLETQGKPLRYFLDASGDVSERVASLLVAYGQALFRGGQPYYKYSETINAVASLKPSIRRSLSYAWDLAFAWLSEEPHCHHKAMPLGILLAVLTTALAWGWAAEAGIFGMAWAGLLRPGEALSARRSDLILPRDAAPGTRHALVVIRNPKTRGRAARHQSARIDPSDIVDLLDAVFGALPGHVPLWPQSGATLRRRLEQIQELGGVGKAGF